MHFFELICRFIYARLRKHTIFYPSLVNCLVFKSFENPENNRIHTPSSPNIIPAKKKCSCCCICIVAAIIFVIIWAVLFFISFYHFSSYQSLFNSNFSLRSFSTTQAKVYDSDSDTVENSTVSSLVTPYELTWEYLPQCGSVNIWLQAIKYRLWTYTDESDVFEELVSKGTFVYDNILLSGESETFAENDITCNNDILYISNEFTVHQDCRTGICDNDNYYIEIIDVQMAFLFHSFQTSAKIGDLVKSVMHKQEWQISSSTTVLERVESSDSTDDDPCGDDDAIYNIATEECVCCSVVDEQLCNGHGECVLSLLDEDDYCDCEVGWTTDDCTIQECSDEECSVPGYGTCVGSTDYLTISACSCTSPYIPVQDGTIWSCQNACNDGVGCGTDGECILGTSDSGEEWYCQCPTTHYLDASNLCVDNSEGNCAECGVDDSSYGSCVLSADDNTTYCECESGWYGSLCTSACPVDASDVTCSDNGTCDTDTNVCDCDVGYGEANCSVQQCLSSTCGGYGECVLSDDDITWECSCDDGYASTLYYDDDNNIYYCESLCNDGIGCGDSVTCEENDDGDYECVCDDNQYVDPDDNTCRYDEICDYCENGYCVKDDDSDPYCYCDDGYTGDYCDTVESDDDTTTDDGTTTDDDDTTTDDDNTTGDNDDTTTGDDTTDGEEGSGDDGTSDDTSGDGDTTGDDNTTTDGDDDTTTGGDDTTTGGTDDTSGDSTGDDTTDDDNGTTDDDDDGTTDDGIIDDGTIDDVEDAINDALDDNEDVEDTIDDLIDDLPDGVEDDIIDSLPDGTSIDDLDEEELQDIMDELGLDEDSDYDDISQALEDSGYTEEDIQDLLGDEDISSVLDSLQQSDNEDIQEVLNDDEISQYLTEENMAVVDYIIESGDQSTVEALLAGFDDTHDDMIYANHQSSSSNGSNDTEDAMEDVLIPGEADDDVEEQNRERRSTTNVHDPDYNTDTDIDTDTDTDVSAKEASGLSSANGNVKPTNYDVTTALEDL
ncbi:hypothetical protein ADUPG1_009043 [Aduncisulcus paluster]|uniref:EGF-like domain-containing protein n=1 Tax=Aduncisulcus paluster TaxID=2918883 RepID=A0ABQ5KWF8_9EUKA|nr:hypothetical protein ADUPG1_009043 [Aduncisulcus paluster]